MERRIISKRPGDSFSVMHMCHHFVAKEGEPPRDEDCWVGKRQKNCITVCCLGTKIFFHAATTLCLCLQIKIFNVWHSATGHGCCKVCVKYVLVTDV